MSSICASLIRHSGKRRRKRAYECDVANKCKGFVAVRGAGGVHVGHECGDLGKRQGESEVSGGRKNYIRSMFTLAVIMYTLDAMYARFTAHLKRKLQST